MKNVVAAAKKILTGVLLLGASYVYGRPEKSKRKQTQIVHCKTNQNNDSAVVFISGRDYIFNEDPRSAQTKISYYREIKTKEIKINDVFFVVEGTVVHNLQDIITYKEKKAVDVRAVKPVAQKAKPHKNISETKRNNLVQPWDIYFSSCNDQNDQLSVPDARYCIPTLCNTYYKQLIIKYWHWNSFFAFSTDLQFDYHINSTSYFFIKSFTIRPPPDGCKYKHITKVYKFQYLTGSKSC